MPSRSPRQPSIESHPPSTAPVSTGGEPATPAAETAGTHASVWHIAVPAPLHRGFDYRVPDDAARAVPGSRIRVPFGRREAVGILLEARDHSAIEHDKLKTARATLDQVPALTPDLLALGHWASRYYHHPIGEVLQHMLPSLLRRGQAAEPKTDYIWRASAEGTDCPPETLDRAPKQRALLRILQQHAGGLDADALGKRFANWRPAVEALRRKGLVRREVLSPQQAPGTPQEAPFELNPDQQAAIDAVGARLDTFDRWLLEGVTGSGKTEVYLRIIQQVLARGRQALVLVPEIGLTPQLLARFQSRLPVAVTVVHSGLGERQRLNAWLAARSGEARVIIGTRSAIFMPLAEPGLIIVDEEHDNSLKQQDGFRYHARDLAIVRAQNLNLPVLLGSATPSLESLHNADQARYRRLHLPARTGKARLPRIGVLDARQAPRDRPLSPELHQRVLRHLNDGGQVLLFLNRRGYAPVYLCNTCGWHAECRRCDAHMTVHRGRRRLSCHHCGAERPLDPNCPDCGAPEPLILGLGTEQVEEYCRRHFPEHPLIRIDRDATRRKGQLENSLEQAQSGAARILIGTQMLAKGHHFPQVTLVGILGIDQALFSADFRSTEHMAQLVTQVAGRAGRADRAGEVVIESHQPEHPLLHHLITRGYREFAAAALSERQAAQLPPFSRMALIRAEAPAAKRALDFLAQLRQALAPLADESVCLLGPAPAPMERRAGRYRAHLLLQAEQAGPLHRTLNQLTRALGRLPQSRRVRWSIDVDPVEMF